MTISEDIEKAIESLQNQLDRAVAHRDLMQEQLDAANNGVKYYRDAIQGLRKMEIERERNEL